MDSERTSDWWVACLCAGWCGVCRDWRPLFDETARAHPGLRFIWVDVEDDAEAMGDMEVDTFPTLLVARGSEALFLGAIPPMASQLTRLIASLLAQPRPSPTLPAGSGLLLRRLETQVFARTAI